MCLVDQLCLFILKEWTCAETWKGSLTHLGFSNTNPSCSLSQLPQDPLCGLNAPSCCGWAVIGADSLLCRIVLWCSCLWCFGTSNWGWTLASPSERPGCNCCGHTWVGVVLTLGIAGHRPGCDCCSILVSKTGPQWGLLRVLPTTCVGVLMCWAGPQWQGCLGSVRGWLRPPSGKGKTIRHFKRALVMAMGACQVWQCD